MTFEEATASLEEQLKDNPAVDGFSRDINGANQPVTRVIVVYVKSESDLIGIPRQHQGFEVSARVSGEVHTSGCIVEDSL